ncbi:MAG: nickel-dependent lactate racemase [Chloroflexota bacterium]|nr:nickel-dependent lactate racemase [Chloroflexota bacterium]
MQTYTLPYGQTQLDIALPDTFQVDLIMPKALETPDDVNQIIQTALSNPIGSLAPMDFPRDATVGIAINDKTRPVAKPNPLLTLVTALAEWGFDPTRMRVFIGSGTHMPMSEEELHNLLPDKVIGNVDVILHDCDSSPLMSLGKTDYGTPIKVNQAYVECDLKFVIGNIEPHHFMGFSGGVKTAAIGLAGRETINANHAMLTQPNTLAGRYSINPMRQDIEEIGRKMGIQFCLGTVLNENKEILRAYFGNPKMVMQKAIPDVRAMFATTLPAPYDLVIASPGGAPKDINLYQAQKGLTNAARIARDDAWVLLLAACPEGSGSQGYESFITQTGSHQAVVDKFKSGFFEVGPHKAFQIARDALRTRMILVSDIPPQSVTRWQLTPSQPDKLESLLNWLTEQLPTDARVAVLPAATRTMTEILNGD